MDEYGHDTYWIFEKLFKMVASITWLQGQDRATYHIVYISW